MVLDGVGFIAWLDTWLWERAEFWGVNDDEFFNTFIWNFGREAVSVVYTNVPATVTIESGVMGISWIWFWETEPTASTYDVDDYVYGTLTFTAPGIYRIVVENDNGEGELFLVVGDVIPTPIQEPASEQVHSPTTAPNLHTASSWAHEGITNAIDLGIVPVSLQNNYTNNITRAEFSALAVALYETVTGREITARTEFNDTTDINVQKMGGLGVVTGVGGGNFAPNNTLTREQAAVMLARLAYSIGQPLPQVASTFADNAQLSSWAVDAVGQIQAAGIMGGVGNNMFSGRGDYTIEQSIITMLRLFEILS